MKKLLILIGCIYFLLNNNNYCECASSSSSHSTSVHDKQQQQQLFSSSIPYHEQLLPAEDAPRAVQSSNGYQINYQEGKQIYQPLSTDSYSSAGGSSSGASSSSSSGVGSNSYGGSAPGIADSSSSYKYPNTVGGYDTPIIQQDSYGPPKPSYGYGPSKPPSYGPPPSSSYGKPVAPVVGDSYAYHYQHYPAATQGGYGDHHHDEPETTGGKGGLFSGLGSSFGGFGGLGEGFGFGEGLGGSGEGGVGGGLGVAKAVIIAIKAVKGILKFKSYFILGLIFLVALPFILLFLPIPVISITSSTDSPTGTTRNDQQSIGRQILLELTDKVLNAEECLERMICKLPQVPTKYQKQAKNLWYDYGSRYITSARIARGVEAYFDSSSSSEQQEGGTGLSDKEKQTSKQRGFKCNQKFKCSNKIF